MVLNDGNDNISKIVLNEYYFNNILFIKSVNIRKYNLNDSITVMRIIFCWINDNFGEIVLKLS